MSKCIKFALSVSLLLSITSLSVTQTNAQKDTRALSPVLQVDNQSPEFAPASATSNPGPEFADCWSKTVLVSSEPQSMLFDLVIFNAYLNMDVTCHGMLGDYSGTMTFYDYETVIATVAVTPTSNGAVFETNSLTPGRHRITATFTSSSDYRSSSSQISQIVDKWPAPTSLSSSANPSTYGQDLTFTVTVSSSIEQPPTGKVRFSDGTSAFGIAALDENGMATLTKKNLAVGTHSITAEYYGDSVSAKTTSAVLTQVVNSTTATALSAAGRNR